jgi:hypothetical protein
VAGMSNTYHQGFLDFRRLLILVRAKPGVRRVSRPPKRFRFPAPRPRGQ